MQRLGFKRGTVRVPVPGKPNETDTEKGYIGTKDELVLPEPPDEPKDEPEQPDEPSPEPDDEVPF